jgi:hypothetical protein
VIGCARWLPAPPRHPVPPPLATWHIPRPERGSTPVHEVQGAPAFHLLLRILVQRRPLTFGFPFLFADFSPCQRRKPKGRARRCLSGKPSKRCVVHPCSALPLAFSSLFCRHAGYIASRKRGYVHIKKNGRGSIGARSPHDVPRVWCASKAPRAFGCLPWFVYRMVVGEGGCTRAKCAIV